MFVTAKMWRKAMRSVWELWGSRGWCRLRGLAEEIVLLAFFWLIQIDRLLCYRIDRYHSLAKSVRKDVRERCSSWRCSSRSRAVAEEETTSGRSCLQNCIFCGREVYLFFTKISSRRAIPWPCRFYLFLLSGATPDCTSLIWRRNFASGGKPSTIELWPARLWYLVIMSNILRFICFTVSREIFWECWFWFEAAKIAL